MSTDPVSSSSPNLPTLPETSQNVTNCHTFPDPTPPPTDPIPTPVQVQRAPTSPPTPDSFPLLSNRQLKAIPLLLQGYSDADVAEAVGVVRESVCRWRNRHPAFIAELNRQRNLLHADMIDRYHRLLARGMNHIERFQGYSHESWLQHQVKVATTLLRTASRRILAPTTTRAPTDPSAILQSLLADGLPPSPNDSPADDAPPPPPKKGRRN